MSESLKALNDEDQIVQSYYEAIASDYDEDRFSNTYGQYIDYQERHILNRWLKDINNQPILDLACGTGRLLNFATTGLDASPSMLSIAREKFPSKTLIQEVASSIPAQSNEYGAIFALHFFMHSKREKIQTILDECHRILSPGGILIFDIPNAFRRSLVSYHAEDWHGATALSISEIRSYYLKRWKWEALEGIMLLPIHRIRSRERALFRYFDQKLCRMPLKRLASYHIVRLIKL
jgi:ubiquinone/menaquinone biosynthesis C-methylase UbiE